MYLLLHSGLFRYPSPFPALSKAGTDAAFSRRRAHEKLKDDDRFQGDVFYFSYGVLVSGVSQKKRN